MRQCAVFAVLTSTLYCPFAITIDQLIFVVARMGRVSPCATLRALRSFGGFVPSFSFHRLGRSSTARVLEFTLFLVVPGAEAVLFPSVANAT